MNNNVKITKSCIVCKSNNIELYASTWDRLYGHNDKIFDVYVCKECKLLFLNPMISDEDLFRMYDEDTYYAYRPFTTKRRRGPLRYIKDIILFVLFGSFSDDDPFYSYPKNENVLNKPRRVFLDLGCGSGAKLYEMKQKGWDVRGVEISSAASAAGNKFELNIFNGTLVDANFKPESFDYIRSNHSFEHLTNPAVNLIEIHKILKPGGKVLIGVPNTKSLTFMFFQRYWYYFCVPVHTYNYNVNNISRLLQDNNFKVIKIRYVGNWQGILGSMKIWLNRKKNNVISLEGRYYDLLAVIFHQIGRLLNCIHLGDCIEVIAQKVE